MLKPSFYNHVTPASSGAVLFNKFWGSVALVDSLTADLLAAGRVAELPAERMRELEDGGFLVPAGTDEKALAEARYLERKGSNTLLGLTVELTQECNLACGFCYQNSYRGTGAITNEGIDRIVRYAEAVITERCRPITAISLRFIGGEPLLQKAKICQTIEHMSRMCARHGVELHAQADTNGLLLDAKVIEVMDALSITITNKADHDKARPRHNGSGSYDQIMDRLRRHTGDFNEQGTVLAVRYNVNALNAKYVGDVYRIVKELGITYTQFDVFNTVNYGYNALTPTLTSAGWVRSSPTSPDTTRSRTLSAPTARTSGSAAECCSASPTRATSCRSTWTTSSISSPRSTPSTPTASTSGTPQADFARRERR